MKSKTILLLICLAGAILVMVKPAGGQLDTFTIENADQTHDFGLVGSTDLGTLLSGIPDHMAVEYANSIFYIALAAPPAGLSALYAQVTPYISVEYANGMHHIDLVAAPPTLSSLLMQIAPKFAIEYANQSRVIPLAYPVEMAGDTVPPLITIIPTHRITAPGSVMISWTTDEFTTSRLQYGTSPGVYSFEVDNNLFEKSHNQLLSGLTEGIPYYYRVISMDRSGNSGTSSEYTFTLQSVQKIYLPLTRR